MALRPKIMWIPTHIWLGVILAAVVAGFTFVIKVPTFFGLPIYVYIGLLLGTLVLLQISIAKHWVGVDFKWHRRNGLLIYYGGIVHATIALSAYILHVPFKTVF